MTCTSGKASQLDAQGIGLGRKWPQRRWPYYYSVCIAREFRAWGPVLKVVFSIVFGDMSAFHKGIQEGIVHVLPKSLPAVLVRF